MNLKCIYIILILSNFISAKGQTPKWAWANSAGISGQNTCASNVSDSYGNLYITGGFRSYPDITFGNITLNHVGFQTAMNIYVVKYDKTGNVLWAKNHGGVGDFNEGLDMEIDTKGNIYIVGYFGKYDVSFDTTILSVVGGSDIFLAKYDSTGKVLWAKSFGGAKSDHGNAISLDSDGNIFMTGSFDSPTLIFGSTTLTNSGGIDLFISKFDSNGNSIWAQSASGINNEYGREIVCDSKGNICLTGYFSSPTIQFGTISKINTGLNDIFLAKYNSNGNLNWVNSYGSANYDMANSIITDTLNNIYLTGSFGPPSINFGAATGIYSSGGADIFITKFDSSGNVLWANRYGGESFDEGQSMIIDRLGYLYSTGSFGSSQMVCGNDTLENRINDFNNPSGDAFLSKLDLNGNAIWAKSIGGIHFDYIYDVSTNSDGDIYISGTFEHFSTLGFDDISLTNNLDARMIFAAKSYGAVGLTEINYDASPYIFPNPTKDDLTIKLSRPNTISIISSLGLLVYKESLVAGLHMINVTDLSRGIYFVKTNERVYKFIKE